MKALLSKIPAIIAMFISLFSFFYYVQSVFKSSPDIWTLSVIIAVLSVIFYFVDAIISFVKARKKKDLKFNYILSLILILAIPMLLFFGGSGIVSFNVIWNAYFLLMFVLEIISIKRISATAK